MVGRRALIERAKGIQCAKRILMERDAVDQAREFEMLRQRSSPHASSGAAPSTSLRA
jgi:AmiR/NasT family two-component response regulator